MVEEHEKQSFFKYILKGKILMTSVIELLRSHRSIRSFEDKKIPEDLLDRHFIPLGKPQQLQV